MNRYFRRLALPKSGRCVTGLGRMFRLWRCGWLERVPRWGLGFLLGGMVLLGAHAAESGGEPADGIEPAPAVRDAREQAIEQLEQLGQQVRQSATATLDLIASTNAPLDLRRRATLALAAIGLENQEQARMLFDILADPGAELDLRRTILMAFGEKELFAPLLVPALLKIAGEKRDDIAFRRETLFALRRFADHEAVLPVLGRVLADSAEETELRLAILDHLRMLVADPTAAIEVLAALARNREEPESLRARAIDAMRGIGRDARSGAPSLVAVLTDGEEDPALRLGAALALRQTGWAESDSPALARLLFHAETPNELRTTLAELTGMMDRLPAMLATQWLPVLEDTTAPLPARRLAARMLATADLGLPDGLGLSTRLLRDPNEDIQIRLGAGEFLRRSGVRAAPARETIESILLNDDAPAELREVASVALAQVAQVWLDRPDRVDRATLNRHLAGIDHTVAVMEQAGLETPPHPQNLEAVRRMRDILRVEKASRWSSGLGDWAEAHPVQARWAGALLVLILGGALLTAGWWGMTWFAPLQLGRLDARLRRHELKFPRALGGRSFGPRHLSLMGFWADHERVLEAWTDLLRTRVLAKVEERQQRADGGIVLDLPVRIDGTVHDTLDVILRRLAEPGGCVAIVGDAGTGKTTLGWRIARRACSEDVHTAAARFLPVWIDSPISNAQGKLLEAIRGQLRSASTDDAPSVGLLRVMLARGRIVPVLDGISEWAATDRAAMLQALEQLGNPSVLITARNAGCLADRHFLQIETPRLAGPDLTRFVAGFLEHTEGERSRDDAEVLAACGYWTELTAGRPMPADGVRLFAEYLLMEKAAPAGTGRPENVLELVRAYVRQRNHRVHADRLPDELVLRTTGRLAWLCAQHHGVTSPSQLPESMPPRFTAYLEQKLALVRTDPATGGIRFLQPTLADHLAAGHLIDTHDQEDEVWRMFEVQPTSGGTNQGNLRATGELSRMAAALWNACYRLSDPFAPIPIPDWLYRAIEQKLDAPGDDRLRPSPRLRQLLRLVLAPENSERTTAIESMAALGPGVGPAIPTLLSAFQKSGEDLEIRHAVLALFLLLGRHAASAAPGLRHAIQDRKEHLFLRIKAIDVLVAAAPDDPASVQLLVDKAGDPAESGLLRDRAAQAVTKLKRADGGPAPASAPGSEARAGL